MLCNGLSWLWQSRRATSCCCKSLMLILRFAMSKSLPFWSPSLDKSCLISVSLALRSFLRSLISASSLAISLFFSVVIALMTSYLFYWRISLICEKLVSMMSVMLPRFSSKSDTSFLNWLPKVLSISGFIELMSFLISSWLEVFWDIRELYSFITVFTMNWS